MNAGEFHGNIRRRNPNTRISCRPGHLENYTRISGTGDVLRRTWSVCAPMAIVNAAGPRRRCKLPNITLVSGDCYNIKLYCYIIYIYKGISYIMHDTKRCRQPPPADHKGVWSCGNATTVGYLQWKMHEFHSFTPQDCL